MDEFIIGVCTKIKDIRFQIYSSIHELPFQFDLNDWKKKCEEMKENNYEVL